MVSALETAWIVVQSAKFHGGGSMNKELDVDGMYCASCDEAVEQEALGVQGVYGVKADYHKGKVMLMFDGSVRTLNNVRLALLKLGFNAWLC